MKTGLPDRKSFAAQTEKNPVRHRRPIRERVQIEPSALKVSIEGSQYLVDFGQGSNPRFHKVGKNKECSCGAPYCEAIEAVRLYLRKGGPRAPDPEGMPPCPICGGKTYRDRTWDGKYTHTLGWRCEKGGLRHFLDAKAERIKEQLAKHPWLIPPAPGYPGVRRDDLMTWEECQKAKQKAKDDPDDDPMI